MGPKNFLKLIHSEKSQAKEFSFQGLPFFPFFFSEGGRKRGKEEENGDKTETDNLTEKKGGKRKRKKRKGLPTTLFIPDKKFREAEKQLE